MKPIIEFETAKNSEDRTVLAVESTCGTKPACPRRTFVRSMPGDLFQIREVFDKAGCKVYRERIGLAEQAELHNTY